MKFIKRDKTKGSLTNDIRGASGIVSNNSSGNSSTTLESHRIWGQLFDGTNDVTGDMQNVGSITATGNIQTDESVIIKQLDADGNEVEGGDLTISVEDKKAKFSGKDQYVFDKQIKSDSAEIDSKLNVNGTTNLKDLNVSSDAEFKSSITVEGDSNLTNVTSTNITNSDTIKTKNLEVTGSAHFFELIIDKIKAAGGAVLFTPANGFKVDIVESVTDGYKLYWQADDGSGNQADNMWKVNDQALCMSFNQAKEGTNHNISNKYYWSLVTAVSDTNQPVSIEEKKYHYIVISTVTKDGIVNPEIGDTIAMLGYRGTDDKKRQSAIYISAYTSLDKGLTAPLLAQYQGINDFNLESHRKSYFDAVGAKFIGNFEVNDGQSVEDYINNKINGAESGTPYIGENGNWYIWDSTEKKYKDSGIKAEGKDGTNGKDGVDGKDAVTYILESTPSTIILNSDGSFNRNNQCDESKYLYVQGYKIVNGKRTNHFTVNGNPITCRLSFNDGDVYTEYTNVYYIGIDFDPQYEDSYYSLLEEIGQNGLKNARAIMFEGTEYAADKVLASIDIPIIQNGKNGTNGKDAILYKMYPSNEYAVVDSDGYLYTNAQYLIYRQIGSSETAITPLSTGYHVQYNITGSWTNATINGSYCVVNSKVKYSSTSNANYIPIRLVSGSGTLETVVDQKVIPVTYKASATLTINQELGEIKTNVQDTQNLVDSLDGDIQTVRNNMSTLTQKANSIESKVTSNTTNINNITGQLSSQSTSISKLEQKADSITSTISSMTKSNGTNLFSFTNTNFQDGNCRSAIQMNGFFTLKLNQGLYRLRNLGTNNEGGDFVVSFDARVLKDTTINVNFCDIGAEENHGDIALTTTFQHYVLHFKNVHTDFLNKALYNGFIDFEPKTLDETNQLYVANFMLERGTIPSEKFSISEADRNNYGKESFTDWEKDPRVQIVNETINGNSVQAYKIESLPSGETFVDILRGNNLQNKMKIQPQKVYTLSFWAKASESGHGICCYLFPDISNTGLNGVIYKGVNGAGTQEQKTSSVDGSTLCEIDSTWRKFYIHWHPHKVGDTINCNVGRLNANMAVWLSDVKLEEGYICEENLTNQETYSSIKQTANEILMSVNNTYLVFTE